jgi:hypothetical protein
MFRKSVHIIPTPAGGWNLKSIGANRAAANFDRKVEAFSRGRQTNQNRHAELVIHDNNGRIAQTDSNGGDPHPPIG